MTTESLTNHLDPRSHGALIALLSKQEKNLPSDPAQFKVLWDETAAEIADVFREGDKDLIDRQAPAMARRIRDLDKEIERSWYHDLERFTRAVDEWKSLWLKGCNLVRQSTEQPSSRNMNAWGCKECEHRRANWCYPAAEKIERMTQCPAERPDRLESSNKEGTELDYGRVVCDIPPDTALCPRFDDNGEPLPPEQPLFALTEQF